jgi:membrane carboxypeptidase/penicillin-binding protein
VVKNLLVGDDVTYERKVREIIVTTRLEQTLTKAEILELYLNSIYFGRNSWGVELAARNWFGKSVKDVTLAEAAMLAGLVKGPNYFSPERAPDRARERLGYVLGRLQEDGVVTADQAKAAQALPALIAAQRPRNEVGQNFFDYLGREVKTLPGLEPLANATYKIRSTIYPDMQAATEAALQEGLAQYEMGSGRVDFQAPEANLAEAIGQLAAARAGAPAATLQPDWQQALAAVHLPLHDVHWTPAVVIDRPGQKRNSGFKVGLADGRTLPLHSGSVTALKKLALYDVVYVKVAADAKGRAATRADLRVRPVVQGAAVVLENRTGRILAMAGGFSYSLSQLNRTSQTRRQPGSAIKPITYLAALRAGLQPNTLIRDEPITLPPINGSTRERDYWSPKNYDGGAMGVLTLRRALENSRNLATVGLLEGGIESTASASLDRVCELAQEAQLYADCQRFYPIVLGAQPVRLIDLAAFYAAIANEGARPAPHAIAAVEQDGRVVWRDDTRAPVWLASADRVAFYQLKSMLQGVVLRGTANSMRDLAAWLAGKTGTSEDENDAWFVGFTNDVTVAVWVGYDNANGRRTLGSGATGGHTAVPIFRPIIEASWKYVAQRAALAPPSAEARRQLVMLPVDLATGTRVDRSQRTAYDQGTGYGQGYGQDNTISAPRGVTITEAFRTDGRGHVDDTQYRIVSELDAGLRIEGDQYGEQQYPDGYRTWYSDRQGTGDGYYRQANPDGYQGYRYYGGPQGGAYRTAPPPSQQYQQPQYGRGLFGWSTQPPPQQQPQPQRRIDPDYFWQRRFN